jgi:hypothetical protein
MGETEAWQGKGRSRTKGEGQQTGMREGICNGKAAAATVVSWGCWWQAHWEQQRRRQRHGMGGEVRYIFRHLDMDGDSGGEGRKAEEEK